MKIKIFETACLLAIAVGLTMLVVSQTTTRPTEIQDMRPAAWVWPDGRVLAVQLDGTPGIYNAASVVLARRLADIAIAACADPGDMACAKVTAALAESKVEIARLMPDGSIEYAVGPKRGQKVAQPPQ